MAARRQRVTNYVLDAEPGHFTVTGQQEASFIINPLQIATLTSSANTTFEELSTEMSKRIEEIANTVSDSE
ncbi:MULTISPECIES: hypothetical protein [unclassified Bradyrhizobium]|uniref:hypothetical protein n=1 Tax=unclassified Bradyrhizobium TaxID=2631580 RepID=UPI0028E239F7|nr:MULTISPECIES: hypothetical protein [unclassified Bradyrhizobium]